MPISRGSDISAAMTEAGVEDMSAHFLLRKRPWGRELRTWSMMREGRVVQYRTYYLLGDDRSLFRNVSVQDPRHNSDHFMVVRHLRSATDRDHACYIKDRQKMPLKPPTVVRVMPRVSDGHVTEETLISPQEVICPRPYHPSRPHHTPGPSFSFP